MVFLIKPPRGFFEPDYVMELQRHFEPAKSITSEHALSSPIFPVRRMHECGIDPRKAKMCDLGSGTGYIIAAFGLHGCRAYGFENNNMMVQCSQALFCDMPLFVAPHVLHADYSQEDASTKQFADGTRMRDIDFFYCYAYNPPHPVKILTMLSGENKARIGAFVYLGTNGKTPGEFEASLGYECVQGSDLLYGPPPLRKLRHTVASEKHKLLADATTYYKKRGYILEADSLF